MRMRRATQFPDEVALLVGLFANSPNFIGIAGLDKKGIFLNRAGRLLVGLDVQEAIDRYSILDFFPQEDHPFIESVAMPILVSEGSWNGEVRFKHFKTGAPIPMLWNAFVIPDMNTGRPTALGCISWNLTELKDIQRHRDELLRNLQNEQQRLLKAQAELQEHVQELEKFEEVVVGRELKMMELEKQIERLNPSSARPDLGKPR